ncbi:UNVERIFIED_CONTAM: hypothetical protein FKN15_005982 [Acipenser sinensis]
MILSLLEGKGLEGNVAILELSDCCIAAPEGTVNSCVSSGAVVVPGVGDNGEEEVRSQFLELQRRLQTAEAVNQRASQELTGILQSIKRIIAEKRSATRNQTSRCACSNQQDKTVPPVGHTGTCDNVEHRGNNETVEWTAAFQLEDDLIARTGYFQTMKNVALQQTSVEWMIIEFSQLGFIGKMFKASDLPVLVEFILMFYKDKPIDWLLDHMLWVKVCHPEKDADNDFGKQILHRANQNPSADITMSLTAYQHFSIEKAYYGQGFFWALTPVSGDHITISFHQPVTVKRYLFRSGNIEHPGDKLFNTSVEVQPANKLVLEKMKEGLLSTYEQTKDGYIRIGAFVNGVAEGEVPPVDKITAIRLFIHSNSPVWVLLSEVTPGYNYYKTKYYYCDCTTLSSNHKYVVVS